MTYLPNDCKSEFSSQSNICHFNFLQLAPQAYFALWKPSSSCDRLYRGLGTPYLAQAPGQIPDQNVSDPAGHSGVKKKVQSYM